MDAPNPGSSSRPKLHPLVATAAVAVILLAVVGIGAVVMDRSHASPSPYDAPATSAAADANTLPSQPVAPTSEPTRVASAPAYVAPRAEPVAPRYEAPAQPAYEAPPPVARAEVCRSCGVVDSIHDIRVKGEGSGIGAVGGAVVGGLLGNMVGAGRGKALATVAGAVGGGFGGNAIEKNVRGGVEHQMIVRLDDGGTRTFTQSTPFAFGVGERVRIVDGHVERG